MKFIPGLELNQKYFFDVVRPLLKEFNHNLKYSSGLIGYGSDVLGLDDHTSMDHNWGPRLQIFLNSHTITKKDKLDEFLKSNLPPDFLGFPTNYSRPGLDGTQRMEQPESARINHLIEIYGLDSYFESALGTSIDNMTNTDWLCVPEQKLLELVSGRVFYDGLKRLTMFRRKLSYYPEDIRKLKIAMYWNCIFNEEAFIGRAAKNLDLIGTKLVSSRIVNYLMKICFAIKKQYIPYSKWFSKQFQKLTLTDIEKRVVKLLKESFPTAIENQIADLYSAVIKLNNASESLPRITNKISGYYQRPYKVIMADKIVELFMDSIEDNEIKKIDLSKIGLDNKIDSEDFTEKRILRDVIQKI